MIKNRSTLESQFPHSEHALDMLEAGLNAAMPENFMLDHHLEKFTAKKNPHNLVWQGRFIGVASVYSAVKTHQSLYSLVQCIQRIYPVYGFPAHLKLSARLHGIS